MQTIYVCLSPEDGSPVHAVEAEIYGADAWVPEWDIFVWDWFLTEEDAKAGALREARAALVDLQNRTQTLLQSMVQYYV